MRVVVTGAAGFIGRHLTTALIRQGQLIGPAGNPAPISELLLADHVDFDAPPTGSGNIPIRKVLGDLREATFRQQLFAGGVGSLFHLAASLTTASERDIQLGLETNILSLLGLLELCRAQKTPPRIIFASSIATFGGDLPPAVNDDTPQNPQTSYGAHKVIAEQLLADHSRHGVIDGRCLRLPIVVIRPAGNPSVSDQVAAILREPLHGHDVDCPFAPESELPIVSVQAVVNGFLLLHDLPAQELGSRRAFNLPALTVRASAMAESLSAYSDGRTLGRVRWKPDPMMQKIVAGWPTRFDSATARRLGILPDADLETIIDGYLESLS